MGGINAEYMGFFLGLAAAQFRHKLRLLQ